MYHIRNEDEFEPRSTPKAAIKLDQFTLPSVPEVSLIFEQPLKSKNPEYKRFSSPSVRPVDDNSFEQKKNGSPARNSTGSYAAWREQNFSQKPSSGKIIDSTYYHKTQCHQSLPQSSRQNEANDQHVNSNVDNGTNIQRQERHNISYDNSCNVVYRSQEHDRNYTNQKTNMRDQHKNDRKNVNTAPISPHGIKRHSKTDNSISYSHSSESHPLLLHERKLVPHDPEQQKIMYSGQVGTAPMYHTNNHANMLGKNDYQQQPNLGYQYPYLDINAYPFPKFYASPYSAPNMDSQETVKNLLQLVNSQSEQIKALQGQIDRLLMMQEENIKERKRCKCSSQIPHHTEQLFLESYDTAMPLNQSTKRDKRDKRDMCQTTSMKDNKSKGYINENRNGNHSELGLPESQSKKTFMEQKVSIGVMTSFEFTVQNSPFELEAEDSEDRDIQQKNETLKAHNDMNHCDSNEAVRRYKNSFARMPSGQLENIVEDSESYLSSSHHQSSNLNASVSTRDFEKQMQMDSQKEVVVCALESPSTRGNMSRKLIRNKANVPQYQETVTGNIPYKPVNQKAVTACNTQRSPSSTPHSSANRDHYAGINAGKPNIPAEGQRTKGLVDFYKDPQKEQYAKYVKESNCVEESLILSSGDLRVDERPPTPEPSIHVEMQEYSSDDESEKLKRTSKVGWTFYNNVLGQVNQILQNSSISDDQNQNRKGIHGTEQDDAEKKTAMDTVKVATLEQLKKLGISLSENPETRELNTNKRCEFDSSFYPRLDCQANVTRATSAVNETNTSMHMKALALKYLSDEQLAELATQRQGSTSLQHLMLSNVQGTNMSFATMRYLERYQLLPAKNNVLAQGHSNMQTEVPQKVNSKFPNAEYSPTLQRFPFNQTPRTTCPSKILDISTLKQQPKLL